MARAQPIQIKTPGVVYADRFDKRVYGQLTERAAVVRQLEERGAKDVTVFPQLLFDLWAALYKADPLLKRKEDVRPVERMNRVVAEKLLAVQQYEELREYTTLDEFATTMALPILGEAALEILLKKAPQLKKLQQEQEQNDQQGQEAQQSAQAAAGAQGEADDLAEQAAQAGADGDSQAEELADQAAEAQQKADQLSRQAQAAQMTFEEAQEILEEQADALIQEISEGPGDDQMRRAIRRAAKEALEQAQDSSDLLEVWGVEPGEIQKLPFEEKLALAQKLRSSRKLQEIARLGGRFRRLAVAKQKEKARRRAGVITTIKRGNDLRRLIPSERRKLAHPFERLDFLVRYATNSLFVYEVEDQETKAEGPVIFCLDQSGSITEEQEIWMKAVALGMFQAADFRGREFVYIHYGGPNDPLFVVRLKTGQANYKDLIRIAEYSLGGGTDFEKPLAKAKEFIEGGLPADIFFFTDGHCAVRPAFLTEFNTARRAVPFHVYSVLLTKGGGTSPAAVKHFSDEIFDVQKLTADEAAEIFAAA